MRHEKIKSTIVVDKSFDHSRTFSKEIIAGDFERFFNLEGEYIDRLVDVMKQHGKENDSFTIVYTITVTKGENEAC